MKRFLRILYFPYQWLIFFPLLVVATLVCGFIAFLLTFIIGPKRTSDTVAVFWARFISWITPIWVTVRGRENIDPKQSYVIVGNHQSQYDIFVVYGWLGVHFKWVLKQELRKVPGLGIACEKMEHVFIDRSHPDKAIESINNAKKRVVDGTSVLFFPEGRRSREGNLEPFKKGAFRFALEMGLPLLPMTLIGTREILVPKTKSIFPGKTEMVIHPPISTEGYDLDNIEELMDKARRSIASALPEKQNPYKDA